MKSTSLLTFNAAPSKDDCSDDDGQLEVLKNHVSQRCLPLLNKSAVLVDCRAAALEDLWIVEFDLSIEEQSDGLQKVKQPYNAPNDRDSAAFREVEKRECRDYSQDIHIQYPLRECLKLRNVLKTASHLSSKISCLREEVGWEEAKHACWNVADTCNPVKSFWGEHDSAYECKKTLHDFYYLF